MKFAASQINQKFASNATTQDVNGVPHLVIPTIAMVPGVLNGVLYREEDFAPFAASWNGVPVPMGHPKRDDDQFPTANTVECEESINVGKFYDARWEDGKLKGNIYLNLNEVEAKGFADILENFAEGKMMEVSTAMLYERNAESGTLDGKDYNAIAKGARPDHVALLTNEIGACSIAGGCGAGRINSQDPQEEENMKNKTGKAANKECCDDCAETEKVVGLRNKLMSAAKDLGVRIGLIANEATHGDIRQQLQLLLDGKRTNKDDPWSWIEDVFSDNFIYSHDGKLLRMSYVVVDEVVKMVGDPVEVVRDTEYKTKPSGGSDDTPALNVDSNKGDNPMKKDEMIKALIASKSSAMSAENQADMEAMSETVLADMVAMAANADKASDKDDMPDKPAKKKGEKDSEAENAGEDDDSGTMAGAKNTLSDADMATFATLKEREDNRVAELRKVVGAANTHLTADMIEAFSVPVLEAMAANVEKPADMGAAAGASTGAAMNKDGTPYRKPPVMLAVNNDDKQASGGAA